MSPSLLIGAVAVIGVLFSPLVSRLIKGTVRRQTAEAGTGDGPEPVDRGPDGMRM